MGVLRKRLEILKNDERYFDTKSGIVGPTGIVYLASNYIRSHMWDRI